MTEVVEGAMGLVRGSTFEHRRTLINPALINPALRVGEGVRGLEHNEAGFVGGALQLARALAPLHFVDNHTVEVALRVWAVVRGKGLQPRTGLPGRANAAVCVAAF